MDQAQNNKPKSAQMTLREFIDAYGEKLGVPRQLRESIFEQESNWNHYWPNGSVKVSPKGARGVGQLMPDTARRLGVADIDDPIQNAEGSLRLQKQLYEKYLKAQGDPNEAALLAAAAYNAGEGAVDKFRGVPRYRETQNYATRLAQQLKANPIQGLPTRAVAPQQKPIAPVTPPTPTRPAPAPFAPPPLPSNEPVELGEAPPVPTRPATLAEFQEQEPPPYMGPALTSPPPLGAPVLPDPATLPITQQAMAATPMWVPKEFSPRPPVGLPTRRPQRTRAPGTLNVAVRNALRNPEQLGRDLEAHFGPDALSVIRNLSPQQRRQMVYMANRAAAQDARKKAEHYKQTGQWLEIPRPPIEENRKRVGAPPLGTTSIADLRMRDDTRAVLADLKRQDDALLTAPGSMPGRTVPSIEEFMPAPEKPVTFEEDRAKRVEATRPIIGRGEFLQRDEPAAARQAKLLNEARDRAAREVAAEVAAGHQPTYQKLMSNRAQGWGEFLEGKVEEKASGYVANFREREDRLTAVEQGLAGEVPLKALSKEEARDRAAKEVAAEVAGGHQPTYEKLMSTRAQGWGDYLEQKVAERTGQYVREARAEQSQVPRLGLMDKLRELSEKPSQVVPFLRSASNIVDLLELGLSAERVSKGEGTEEDELKIREYQVAGQQDQTMGYKIANIVSALPGFALELGATSGAFTFGREAAVRGLEKLITKKGLGMLEQKLTGKLLSKSIQNIAGAAAQTIPAGAASIPEGVLYRQREGKDFATALAETLGDQFIEVASERTGGIFSHIPVPKRLAAIRDAITARWIAKSPGRTAAQLQKLVEKTGWHGPLGEVFEERVGDIARYTAGLQDYPIAGAEGGWRGVAEQLLTEGLAFSVPSAGAAAATRLERKAPQVAKAVQRGASRLLELAGGKPAAPTPEAPAAEAPEPKTEFAGGWTMPDEAAIQDVVKFSEHENVAARQEIDFTEHFGEYGLERAEVARQYLPQLRQRFERLQKIKQVLSEGELSEADREKLTGAYNDFVQDYQAAYNEFREGFDHQASERLRALVERDEFEDVDRSGAETLEFQAKGANNGATVDVLKVPEGWMSRASIQHDIGGFGDAGHSRTSTVFTSREAAIKNAAQKVLDYAQRELENPPPNLTQRDREMLPRAIKWAKSHGAEGEIKPATIDEIEQTIPEPEEAEAKEPWEMTREEFRRHVIATEGPGGQPRDIRESEAQARIHRDYVETAIREGKTVPPEVLAEYPDLAPKPEKEEADKEEEPPPPPTAAKRVRFRTPKGDIEGTVIKEFTTKEGVPTYQVQVEGRDKPYTVAQKNTTVLGGPTEAAPPEAKPPKVTPPPKPKPPQGEMGPGERRAYKGYLITAGRTRGEYHVSKDNTHITTQPTLAGAKAAIDSLVPAAPPPPKPPETRPPAPPPEAKPPSAPPPPAGTKPPPKLSPETLERIRKAKEKLQQKGGPAPTGGAMGMPEAPGEGEGGFDEEDVLDVAMVGHELFQNGIRDQAEWGQMLRDLIDPAIEPYLADIWETAVLHHFNEGGDTSDLPEEWNPQEAAPPQAPEEKEPEEEEAEEPETPEHEDLVPGTTKLRNRIYDFLHNEQGPLGYRQLDAMADEAFGGSRAEGRYEPRDMYDALEAALAKHIGAMDLSNVDPREALAQMRRLVQRLPTQTTRTAEQIGLQQFSTPPTIGYIAAVALQARPQDVGVEPSAGTGILAALMRAVGTGQVHVNEISPRRSGLLHGQGYDSQHRVDAQHLNALLPQTIRPTIVLMNPPFSTQMGIDKTSTKNGFDHIEQALARLEPGGRLVAVLGQSARFDRSTMHDYWDRLMKKYNVRANIGIPGDEYRKFGTTFGTQLIVIDKVGPTPGATFAERMNNVVQVDPADLEGVLDAVQQLPLREQTAPPLGGGRGPGESPSGGGPGGQSEAGGERPPAGGGPPGGTGTTEPGLEPGETPPTGPEEVAGEGGEAGGTEPGGTEPAGPGGAAPGGLGGPGEPTAPTAEELGVEYQTEASKREAESDLFVDYKPAKLTGGQPHPGRIVESASLAAVDPPDITYVPDLDPEIISKGIISGLQLERITYAGQRHNQRLPNGQRSAYYVGDGTGVGKTRILAGISLDNWNQLTKAGKPRRIAWFTVNDGLVGSVEDAMKALLQLPQKADLSEHFPFHLLGDYDLGDDLGELAGDGMMFVTYNTFIQEGSKVGESRYKDVLDWLGEDGVIILDEAHKAKNAEAAQGAGSQTGEKVVRIQEEGSPDLKVVYASATGATEIQNMAYMQRLGLWGQGLSFPDFEAFKGAIRGDDLGAMEMITRDMKALGMYGAAQLSYKGVTYRSLKHQLDEDQEYVYNVAARAWQQVIDAFETALNDQRAPGQRRGRIRSQFYSTEQRFFRLLLTAMKTPTLLADIEKVLADPVQDRFDPESGKVVKGHGGVEYTEVADSNSSLLLPPRQASGDPEEVRARMNMQRQVLAAGGKQPELTVPNIGKTRRMPAQVVISFLYTGESQADREVTQAKARGISLEELDFSPKRMLISLVDQYFPTERYRDVPIPGTNRTRREVVVDEDGNPVHDPELVARKQAMIAELDDTLKLPENPMDQIVNYFGPENVAEITGRSKRLIRDPVTGKEEYVLRTGSEREGRGRVSKKRANLHEREDFQNGDKRIAMISKAAQVGIDLHADSLKPSAHHRRVHYIFESAWSADDQLQNNGRTHRTNQNSEPDYVLVESNVGGEGRFFASVARRMANVGALSQGERKATGSTFDDYDFENQYGQTAARTILQHVQNRRAPPEFIDAPEDWDAMDVLRKMGLTDNDPDDVSQPLRVKPGEITSIGVTRFLNRVLALELHDQNPMFRWFIGEMERIIEAAKSSGTFDAGISDIKGLSVRKAQQDVVHRDQVTGAASHYVKLEVDEPTVPVSVDDVKGTQQLAGGFRGRTGLSNTLWRQKVSGNIIFVQEASARTDPATGATHYFFFQTRPSGRLDSLISEQDLREKYEQVQWADKVGEPLKTKPEKPLRRMVPAPARPGMPEVKPADIRPTVQTWWNQQYERDPGFVTREKHLITSPVVPLWTRLTVRNARGDAVRLHASRAVTDDNERVVGIDIPSRAIREVLRRLGAGAESARSPEDVFNAVYGNGEDVELMGGMKLKRTVLRGNRAIQIHGVIPTDRRILEDMGVIVERGLQTRYFVPADPTRGIEVLGKMLGRWPVFDPRAATTEGAELEGGDEGEGGAAGMPGQSALEEKKADVAEWERRQVAANKRVEAGKYEYAEPQDEEDGLSAASIDDELGLQYQELDEMTRGGGAMGMPAEAAAETEALQRASAAQLHNYGERAAEPDELPDHEAQIRARFEWVEESNDVSEPEIYSLEQELEDQAEYEQRAMARVNGVSNWDIRMDPEIGMENVKVSTADVRDEFLKMFEAIGHSTSIRSGRMGRYSKTALGITLLHSQVIRLKEAWHIPVMAHEAGHALQAAIYGSSLSPAIKHLPLPVRRELVKLGKDLYGSTKPYGGYISEGFAEFMRYYLTTEEAPARAPLMTDFLENQILPNNPKLAKAFPKVKKKIDEYRFQGEKQRSLAQTTSEKSLKQRYRETVRSLTKELPKDWIDELTPIFHTSRAVQETAGVTLQPKQDPEMLAKFYRGTGNHVARLMFEKGMVDGDLNFIGPSYDQAVIGPLRNVGTRLGMNAEELLGQYLWALRAIERLSPYVLGGEETGGAGMYTKLVRQRGRLVPIPKEVKNPGKNIEQAQYMKRLIEEAAPEVQLAAAGWYKFYDGLINYVLEVNPDLEPAVRRQLRTAAYYAPLQRSFDEIEAQVMGKQQAFAGQPLVREMKGSGRGIIAPTRQIFLNFERAISNAHKHRLWTAILDLEQIPGIGKIVERVPVGKMPVNVPLDRIRKQLEDAGIDTSGANGDEILTYFLPMQRPNGPQPIMPLVRNGKVTWYEISPELYNSLAGLDVFRPDKTFYVYAQYFARAFRLGTTGLRPGFGLISNPAKDIPAWLGQSQIKSKNSLNRFQFYTRSLGASLGWLITNQAKWRTPGFMKQSTELYKLFKRLPIELAQPLGYDIQTTRKYGKRLWRPRGKEILRHPLKRVVTSTPIDFLRTVFGWPEAIPRIAEMVGLMKDVGYKPGDPMDMNTAIMLAVAAREATVDFSAAGAKAKVWNQVVPFFNPAIQGTRSFARAWKRSPYNAFMTGMTLATASLMLWWLYKDEDWFRDLDEDERNRFWNVKVGDQVLQIPKSQEWGTIFGTLPVELIDSAYQEDPDRAISAMKFLMDSMRPNVLPVPVSAALEQSSNWNEFFGRPIVPAAYEELAAPEQWNQYTSETAKYLARHLPNWRIPYMNVPINSPMRIDAAIREFGGGVGADIVNAPRLISKTGQALKGAVSGEGAGEDYTPSDLPVVGRLFRRGGVVGTGRSPQVTKFYEKLTEARQLSVSKERVETEEQRTARLNLEEANVAIKALRDGARDEKNAKKRDDMYRLLNDFARRALAGEQVYTPKKRTEREETQHERSREKREQRAIERWSGERKGEEGGSRGPTRRRPSLPTSPLAP